MGKSIDKTIEIFQGMKKGISPWYPEKYFDVAIETMRKYQKIEEIYKNWCYPTYFNATDAMNKLGEVLKDGNDD